MDLIEKTELSANITNGNAPIKREVKINSAGQAHGVGRRKSAVSKVWIKLGSGHIKVNGKSWTEYFSRAIYQHEIARPLAVSGNVFDISVVSSGGGMTGQAEATRLALARAIVNFNPEFYPGLRSMGLMTDDPRRVERKKCGKVKARKSKPTSRR